MSKTKWIASVNKPTGDNPPCETVLMATEKQFSKFAAKVSLVNPYVRNELSQEICLFCEKMQGISAHENDCIWVEAKQIVWAEAERIIAAKR